MKKQQITLLSLLCLLALTWTSCEEKIDIDVNSSDPKLVVEGQLTDSDELSMNYIRLSLSTNYFGAEETPYINNANVMLFENGNLIDTLTNYGEGYYYAGAQGFKAQVGNTYAIRIEYDGEAYEAEEPMLPVPDIDSLTFEFAEGSLFVDEGYYVYINTQEFPEPGDHYRFLYYTNGVLQDARGFIVSDEFVNGSYISYNFNNEYTHELGDTVIIQALSITEDAYNFYSDLDNQQETGNLFDTPSGNIRGNISNGAFGFFEVSSVKADSVVVLE